RAPQPELVPVRSGSGGRERQLEAQRLPPPGPHHHVQRPRGEGEGRGGLGGPVNAERGHRSAQPPLGENEVHLAVLAPPREREARRPHPGEPGGAPQEDRVLPGEEELARGREADFHRRQGSTSRASPPGRQRTPSTAPASRASRSTSASCEARVSSTGFGP